MSPEPFARVTDTQYKTAADLREPTVTMLFPQRVTLTLPDNSKMVFEQGTNEVPQSLVDHWYLKANGVVKYITDRLPEFEPELIAIARYLWSKAKVDAFVAVLKDIGALIKVFETEKAKALELGTHVESTDGIELGDVQRVRAAEATKYADSIQQLQQEKSESADTILKLQDELDKALTENAELKAKLVDVPNPNVSEEEDAGDGSGRKSKSKGK